MDEPMSTEGAVILLEDIATLIRRYNKLGGEALGQLLDSGVDLWRQRGVPEDFIAKVQHRRLMAVEYAIEVLRHGCLLNNYVSNIIPHNQTKNK